MYESSRLELEYTNISYNNDDIIISISQHFENSDIDRKRYSGIFRHIQGQPAMFMFRHIKGH